MDFPTQGCESATRVVNGHHFRIVSASRSPKDQTGAGSGGDTCSLPEVGPIYQKVGVLLPSSPQNEDVEQILQCMLFR